MFTDLVRAGRGADVSEGLGKSYSVGYVIDRKHDELIARVRTNRLDAVQFAEVTAAELLRIGVNMNMAPVMDIAPRNIKSVMADRAFGHDPINSAAVGKVDCVAAYVVVVPDAEPVHLFIDDPAYFVEELDALVGVHFDLLIAHQSIQLLVADTVPV